MRSLKHINAYLCLHGKNVTKKAIEKFLHILHADIKAGRITKAKDKFHKETDRIQNSLVGMVNAMRPGEVCKIQIEPASKKHYESIIEKQGLGFIPMMVGAAIAKLTEHHVHKLFAKKEKPLAGVAEKKKITKRKSVKKTSKRKPAKKTIKKKSISGPQKGVKEKDGLVGAKKKRVFKPKVKKDLGTISAQVDEVLSNFRKERRSGSTKKYNTHALPSAKKIEVVKINPTEAEIVYAPSVHSADKLEPSSVSTMGTISATEMGNMTFTKLKFNDYYKGILGEPATDFDMSIDGSKGSGKTVYLLKFANYLADYHGPVLYVSSEEFGSASLIDKIQRFGITSKNLRFVKKMPSVNELLKYKFIFIDSINHVKITIDEYRKIREEKTKPAFILVFQQTKEGQSKGSTDWPHEVSIVASLFKDEFGERMLKITKDRFDVTDNVPRVVKI